MHGEDGIGGNRRAAKPAVAVDLDDDGETIRTGWQDAGFEHALVHAFAEQAHPPEDDLFKFAREEARRKLVVLLFPVEQAGGVFVDVGRPEALADDGGGFGGLRGHGARR